MRSPFSAEVRREQDLKFHQYASGVYELETLLEIETRPEETIKILEEQKALLKRQVIEMHDWESSAHSYVYTVEDNNRHTPTVAQQVRINELVDKGKELEILHKANQDNPMLQDLWKKYMMGLRLQYGDGSV